MSTEARAQLVNDIKASYQEEGGLDYFEAIQALIRECGYAPWEAESMVNGWEEDDIIASETRARHLWHKERDNE
jgi:hypothetical protein